MDALLVAKLLADGQLRQSMGAAGEITVGSKTAVFGSSNNADPAAGEHECQHARIGGTGETGRPAS